MLVTNKSCVGNCTSTGLEWIDRLRHQDLGIREIPSGVSLTPSGFFAIFIIGVQQLWAPWGIVKYKQRLKDDEQAWLDLGVSPEQAVTRAYNNMRPPPKVEMKADDEPQEDAEQAADNESE